MGRSGKCLTTNEHWVSSPEWHVRSACYSNPVGIPLELYCSARIPRLPNGRDVVFLRRGERTILFCPGAGNFKSAVFGNLNHEIRQAVEDMIFEVLARSWSRTFAQSCLQPMF